MTMTKKITNIKATTMPTMISVFRVTQRVAQNGKAR